MYIILYILALLFLPFTQSQNNNSSLCISLKNSKICPAFQNYSINTLRGPKWIQNSTTVESLDLNIHQYILSTPWWQLLSNNNNNTCSSSSAPLVNSNSNNTRYFQTIVCYRLISRSIRTCQNNPSQPPALCDNTCQQFIQSLSLNTTTSITNTCFNNQTTVYNQLCSPSRSINNNTCIDGYQNEAYCGWLTQEKYCQYCSINQNDTCCTTMQSSCQPLSPPPSQHNNDNNDSIIEQSYQQQRYSSGQIAGIAIGSFLASCLLLFGCCCLYKKKKKKNIIASFHWPKKPYKDHHQYLISPVTKKKNGGDAKQDFQNRKLLFGPTSEVACTTTQSNPSTFRYTLTGHSQYQQQQDRNNDHPPFYQAIYVNLPRDDFDIMIHKNDLIYLFCYTDEDWGIGYNLNTGSKGLFPLICIRSITINEVWDIIDQLPSSDERDLLKFRATYFISNNKAKNNDDDHDGDQEGQKEQQEQDDDDIHNVRNIVSPFINSHTNNNKEQQDDSDAALIPFISSDDDLSPITPPATFHRSSFNGNNNTTSYTNRLLSMTWSSSSPSTSSSPFSKPSYLPLDSFTTLNQHESTTTTTTT